MQCANCPVGQLRATQDPTGDAVCQICILKLVTTLPETHKAVLLSVGEKWAYQSKRDRGKPEAVIDPKMIVFEQQEILRTVVRDGHQTNVVRHAVVSLEAFRFIDFYSVGRTKMMYPTELGRVAIRMLLTGKGADSKGHGTK